MRAAVPLRLVRPIHDSGPAMIEARPLRLGLRWPWFARDQTLHALAALNEDDICHLSEAGRRLRQAARRQYGLLPADPK